MKIKYFLIEVKDMNGNVIFCENVNSDCYEKFANHFEIRTVNGKLCFSFLLTNHSILFIKE